MGTDYRWHFAGCGQWIPTSSTPQFSCFSGDVFPTPMASYDAADLLHLKRRGGKFKPNIILMEANKGDTFVIAMSNDALLKAEVAPKSTPRSFILISICASHPQ